MSPYLERPLRTLAEFAAARSSEEREPPEQLADEPGAMGREELVHQPVRIGTPGGLGQKRPSIRAARPHFRSTLDLASSS